MSAPGSTLGGHGLRTPPERPAWRRALDARIDRWMADRDFVTREEFDAVRAMAQKAREENAALEARIAALEGKK